MAALFDLWEKELPRLSGKSKLTEAIRYVTSRRIALERFLIDGRIEIDSNIAERAIRLQTITRRMRSSPGLMWRSNLGNHRDAFAESEMNDVDPYAGFTQTLERIAHGWPLSQIDRPGTSTPELPRLHAYT